MYLFNSSRMMSVTFKTSDILTRKIKCNIYYAELVLSRIMSRAIGLIHTWANFAAFLTAGDGI